MKCLQVKVLFAGGCKDCAKFSPLISAEMYDPVQDTWEAVADLPKPLTGAKLQKLKGLPTIIGGWDGHKHMYF